MKVKILIITPVFPFLDSRSFYPAADGKELRPAYYTQINRVLYFPSDAEGTAVPCGICDMTANTGSFFVGKSYDTPEFAAECVTQ